jgi:hypothetical protein
MKTDDPSEASGQAEARSEDHRKRWWFDQPAPIDRFTGWLVAWTFLLFVATIISALVLWKTDHTLRETLEATNRAWVAVVSADLDNAPAAGLPILGHINFKNTGQSPALKLNYVMFLQLRPADQNPPSAKEDVCGSVPNGSIALFPGDTHAASFPYGKEGEPSAALMSGKENLYWRGCFRYLTFERMRHTQFCFYLRQSGPRWHWQDCGVDAD